MAILKTIPEEIAQLGLAIAEEYECYLAGGALRDIDHGRAVKDFDFYVRLDDHDGVVGVASEQKGYNSGIPLIPEFPEDPYEFETFDCAIGEWSVQIIGVPVPKEYILRGFDIDFCKIFFDFGTGTLHRTMEYRRDAKNKHVTIHKRLLTNPEHVLRILEKYPDFTTRFLET